MKNVVSAHWLQKHIDDKNIVILDCRFDLYNSGYGEKAYQKSHIKNAIFLNLDKELVGLQAKHGGARPLPGLKQIISVLKRYNINKNSIVIGYDDQMNAAARVWWSLKYFGYNNCYLLNGGFKNWETSSYPITSEIKKSAINSENIDISVNEDMVCEIEHVKFKKDLSHVVLIDGREEIRYTGEKENLYKKAGHIPGAVNFPGSKNFQKNGLLKEKKEISRMWNWLKPYQEIILYCGSGIAASVNFLVLDELGYSPKLYIGGFSDWISYSENEIARGKEEKQKGNLTH